MNKKLIIRTLIGFLVGATIGLLIKYFRDVNLAPYICSIAGAMMGAANYKKEKF